MERDDSDWNWTNTGHAQFGQVKLGGQAIRKTDDELKAEPGAEWVTELKKTVADKLLLQSTLATFTNFKGWDEATLDWTSTVSYQLSKYINVNASGELRRDIQQFDGWQWKHQFSLGLNYSFL